jgi:long-chain acyl-CoA synthetase
MTSDLGTDLVSMFAQKAQEQGDKPFLWQKRDEQWQSTSWSATADQAAKLATGLKSLGLAEGDRVMLVSESRPEWPVADLAIMAAGGITVPAYTTNGVSDHLHIMTDSGACGVIVSNAALLARVLPAAEQAEAIRFVVTMDDMEDTATDLALHSWSSLSGALADGTGAQTLTTLAASLGRDSTACLIYTSGTGGTPKGVMTSHGAILSNCRDATGLLQRIGLEDEVFLSFLPLSHSYEHTGGLYWPISIAAQIYYAEGIDKLAANMAEVSPTLMTAVPRLYESMRDRILRGVAQAGGTKEKLFHKTVALGRKKYENGGRLSFFDSLQDKALDGLVRQKVAERFGGRLKAFVSGGAPLNYEVGMFFTGLGIRLLQGYGQTESGPVISVNPPENYRIDSVGIPLQEAEVKIAEDGEILARGELVMQGYWNRPDATAETIVDGWLHTGDIGVIDPDGHIRITDRKKDIIVNSGGDNVSPQRVEGFLVAEPEIHQAMVHGDKRPHLVALIVPDPDFVKQWAKDNDKPSNDMAALMEDSDLRSAISDAVDRMNKNLSVIERVRRFILIDQEFTIDNEMMTPTMKIRRHVVRDNYGDKLEALYG